MSTVEIVDVASGNLDEHGFFCYKSKPKATGYVQKRDWLEKRISEGLKLKLLYEEGRSVGFIEYAPGEYAWRAVEADGYTVIHCLWVVGRAKGKGYGKHLLEICLQEARATGKHGVVMVATSSTWLARKGVFLQQGFEVVDQAPPTFELLVKKFDEASIPTFVTNWKERCQHYGNGLTVIRSNQCPYLEDATQIALETASEMNLKAQVFDLKSTQQIRELAPSPYGVFNLVYNSKLLSYHYELKKDLLALIGNSK